MSAGDGTGSPLPKRVVPSLDLAFLTDLDEVTEIVLVRHGEQRFPDAPGGPIGDFVDPELTERGVEQARLVGEHLASEHIDAVYSSNLRRANRTGLSIAGHHGLEVVVDSELREIELFRDVPRGQSPSEVIGTRQLQGMRERMARERTWDVYSHSEPSLEFRRRISNAVEGIAASHPGQRVVIACHGGVINAYIATVLGISADMWVRPAHASISRVRAKGQVRALDSVNETSHLRTAEGSFVSW